MAAKRHQDDDRNQEPASRAPGHAARLHHATSTVSS